MLVSDALQTQVWRCNGGWELGAGRWWFRSPGDGGKWNHPCGGVDKRQWRRKRDLCKKDGWRHVTGNDAAAHRTLVPHITAGAVVRRRIRHDVHRHRRLRRMRHGGGGRPNGHTQAYQHGEDQTKHAHNYGSRPVTGIGSTHTPVCNACNGLRPRQGVGMP